MKSQLKIKEVEEFPKLMVSRLTGMVVLFSDERSGMVMFVHRYSVELIGQWHTGWAIRNFTPTPARSRWRTKRKGKNHGQEYYREN